MTGGQALVVRDAQLTAVEGSNTHPRRATAVAIAASAATAIIGTLGAASHLTGVTLLPTWPAPAPLALWATSLFALVGIGLLVTALWPRNVWVRRAVFVVALAGFVAGVATLIATALGLPLDIEHLAPFRNFSRLPATEARSTGPLGAPVVAFASLAVLLYVIDRGRAFIGALASIPLLAGVLVCVGFLYQSPVLRVSGWRPISLAAAVACIFLSIGLISLAGPDVWPLRAMAGPSVRAQLLRWFLPFTVLTALGSDVLTATLFSSYSPAVSSVLNTLLSMAGAAVVTYFVSLGIGGRLDQAERERERLEEQLRQAQKMETIGQLAGGIAHDFNNMLSIVMANTELVAAALPPESEEAAAELRDVRDAANRGKALVRQLMAFSRVGTLEPEAIDLGALALRVARMLQRMLPATVSVECVVDPGLDPAWADPGAVEQLVLNLSTNARDAMPHGGRLIISVQAATARDVAQQSPDVRADGYLCLTVTDTGTGMDAATLQRMFDPFFTTKPPGKGTGLGLAMVRGIMEQHGGFVRITSEVGRGTSARLCFPVARGAVPDRASETAHPGERALRGTETVLVVEDEEALRRAVQRMLERYGYTVLTAEDGEIALEMLRRGTPHADLILTDLIMPHMGGIELYDRVMRELGPRRFLIVSGYSPVEAPSSGGPPVGVPFIRKPWTLVEVLEAVRKTLDAEIT